MKNFQISKNFIEAIKNQALSSKNEIYGWLIGYEERKIPKILAIVECKKFVHQTVISAKPEPQEFQEISSIMPQGIGPIGIYHSHPSSGEVYHSHIDDSTLVNFSNYFPRCVSIVTNGKEINYYQMEAKKETQEIKAEFVNPKIPQFFIISFEELFKIRINNDHLSQINADSIKFKIKLMNFFKEYLENVWNDMLLFFNGNQINRKDTTARYLTSSLLNEPIYLKFPLEFRRNGSKEIFIDLDDTDSNINNGTYLNLNIEIKIPIYTSFKKESFENLDQLIKTELINNNLLPKLYNSIVNADKREIITPDDHYLNFFGFYIKLQGFNRDTIIEENLSTNIYVFLLKRLSTFKSFKNIKISKIEKNQIRAFFSDLRELSNNFDWKQNIYENINSLSEELKL
jgi:proteasome lid subunit RPN8/RPN11